MELDLIMITESKVVLAKEKWEPGDIWREREREREREKHIGWLAENISSLC